MPNEIRSASESSCTPKTLVVPVMRAMRPSSMSSTTAKPMNGAAVAISPFIANTTQAQPQNRLASVNRLGSSETPRRMPRRSWPRAEVGKCRSLASGLRLCAICVLRCQRREVRFAADHFIAHLDMYRRRQRQEHIDARAELHHAVTLSRDHFLALRQPAHDAAGEDADDLALHDGTAGRVEPDLRPFVELTRFLLV